MINLKKKYKIRLLFLTLSLYAFYFLINCADYRSIYKERAKKCSKSDRDIVIGIVDSSAEFKDLFIDGTMLAIDNINSKGGINGRKIKALIYNDEGKYDKGRKIAYKLARNTEVMAVIGHRSENTAKSASEIYDLHGALFICPMAEDTSLTFYNFSFLFRNMPDYDRAARQLADIAVKKGFTQGIAVTVRSPSYERMGRTFSDQAKSFGVSIPVISSFYKTESDFRSMIAKLQKLYKFEFIFIGAGPTQSAEFIKQARSIGVAASFFGGYDLDSQEFIDKAGKAAEGVIMASAFTADKGEPRKNAFIKKFVSRFMTLPDVNAAYGYDAVILLAEAIKKTGSTVPSKVVNSLKYLKKWQGVTGTYNFNTRGDSYNKKINFKTVINGKLQTIKIKEISYKDIKT